MSKKRKDCYLSIFNKIDHIDDRIEEIKKQLASLKEGFLERPAAAPITVQPVLKSDPKGDA